MKGICDGEILSIASKHAYYTQTEEQYFSDIKKFLSLKSNADPAQLSQIEQDCTLKKHMLDLQRYDLDAVIKEIDERTQLAVYKSVSDIVSGYYDYFKTGYCYIFVYIV